MSSIFSELYADFRDTAKVYHEKLDVTPQSFMRLYTRAMQEFQRETEYIEKIVQINKASVAPFFVLPRISGRVMEIRDDTGRQVLLNDVLQYSRNIDIQPWGEYETPVDYDSRLGFDRRTALGTVYDRQVVYQGMDLNTTFITVKYIPDLPAFTAPELVPDMNDIWAAWFPLEINFELQFTTRRVTPELAPYEQAFTDKAIALYLRSKGIGNYRVFEDEYNRQVENAKFNKPTYWKEGNMDYHLAPYS